MSIQQSADQCMSVNSPEAGEKITWKYEGDSSWCPHWAENYACSHNLEKKNLIKSTLHSVLGSVLS